MASPLMSSSNLLLLLVLLVLLSRMSPLPAAHAFDFEVGDEVGWAVPPSNNTQIYNHWASRNRFQIGDTVRFVYSKDSVMVVSEEDYESCRSSHPLFFSNTGRTELKLDRSGMFYFISGTAGHCERGQKMIIRVISHPEGPSPSGSPSTSNSTASAESSGSSATAGGVIIGMASPLEVIIPLVVVSLFQ